MSLSHILTFTCSFRREHFQGQWCGIHANVKVVAGTLLLMFVHFLKSKSNVTKVTCRLLYDFIVPSTTDHPMRAGSEPEGWICYEFVFLVRFLFSGFFFWIMNSAWLRNWLFVLTHIQPDIKVSKAEYSCFCGRLKTPEPIQNSGFQLRLKTSPEDRQSRGLCWLAPTPWCSQKRSPWFICAPRTHVITLACMTSLLKRRFDLKNNVLI